MVAQKSVSVMALAERVVALGNLNAISDGASAAAMARAALTSAGYNVRINLAGLADKTTGDASPQPVAHARRKGCQTRKRDPEIHPGAWRVLAGMKSASPIAHSF